MTFEQKEIMALQPKMQWTSICIQVTSIMVNDSNDGKWQLLGSERTGVLQLVDFKKSFSASMDNPLRQHVRANTGLISEDFVFRLILISTNHPRLP